MDRRIVKTQVALKDALISLLSEKEINKITVKELCEKADINRGTFYSHYKDQNDLYDSILAELFRNLETYIKKSMDIDIGDRKHAVLFLSKVFNYCRNNAEYTSVFLVPYRKSVVSEQIANFSKRYNIYRFNPNHPCSPSFERYYYTYISLGVIGVVQEWIENGMVQSDEDMAEIIFELVDSTIPG